jgi:DNA-directed RNA polymerase specialized sigma24 family protein
MKTVSMRISGERELVGQKLTLRLATLAAMAGIGYAFCTALRLVANQAEAEDIAQEVFLKA